MKVILNYSACEKKLNVTLGEDLQTLGEDLQKRVLQADSYWPVWDFRHFNKLSQPKNRYNCLLNFVLLVAVAVTAVKGMLSGTKDRNSLSLKNHGLKATAS